MRTMARKMQCIRKNMEVRYRDLGGQHLVDRWLTWKQSIEEEEEEASLKLITIYTIALYQPMTKLLFHSKCFPLLIVSTPSKIYFVYFCPSDSSWHLFLKSGSQIFWLPENSVSVLSCLHSRDYMVDHKGNGGHMNAVKMWDATSWQRSSG